MPKKPSPPNPDKDRRAFLRSVLLDPSSSPLERTAALEELEQLLRAIPNTEPTRAIEPSAQKRPPIQPLPLEAFLPKDPPLLSSVAYGIMQHFFVYYSSTVDAEARGHLQDLLIQARSTHRDWETLEQEIVGWKVELESDPLVWAQAVHDIAGNYQEFRQDLLQQDPGWEVAYPRSAFDKGYLSVPDLHTGLTFRFWRMPPRGWHPFDHVGRKTSGGLFGPTYPIGRQSPDRDQFDEAFR